MFGAIMFVPLFVQGAIGALGDQLRHRADAADALADDHQRGSGQVVSRTGRYRWALLAGPVVIAVGSFLLSSLDADSSRDAPRWSTVVLGLGLGLILQNLVLWCRTRPPRALGAATSATQFFRSVGGTIGVTVMGAILTAGLPPAAESASPEQLAHAIHPVFMIGMP